MLDLPPTLIDLHMAAFIQTRRESAARYRSGQPSFLLGPVAATMGGFARVAARMERWARGDASTVPAPANRTQTSAR